MSRAFITGVAGPVLGADERRFLEQARPWGAILFTRNIETPAQLRRLTDDIRDALGRSDVPILIDQEGGRVARLRPPHWPAYPPGGLYAAIYAKDPALGLAAARSGARLIADDLMTLGITVDCLPIADVPVDGADAVIGDRAYGSDPETVAALARAIADGLAEGGVLPVLKHIPGHGRAGADSHKALPVVDTAQEILEKTDFFPFRALRDLPMAMTAHVVFSAIDPAQPATTSATMISNVIRGVIGFDGLLMSDDVSMKALSGTIAERSRAALAAGCDVVLHCNGDRAEMDAVAAAAPVLTGRARQRAEAALASRRQAVAFDRAATRVAFNDAVVAAGWGEGTA